MFPPCPQVSESAASRVSAILDAFNRTFANIVATECLSKLEIAARYLGLKIAAACQILGSDIEATVRRLSMNIEIAAVYIGMDIECTADFLRGMLVGIEERRANNRATVPSTHPRPPIQREDPCIKTVGNARPAFYGYPYGFSASSALDLSGSNISSTAPPSTAPPASDGELVPPVVRRHYFISSFLV